MVQGQDILDNISTGVIALDVALRVTGLNNAGEALLKTSEARCLGLHAGQLVSNPDEWLANLQQVRSTKAPMTRRGMPVTLLTGEEIHLDIIITPMGREGTLAIVFCRLGKLAFGFECSSSAVKLDGLL